MTKKMGIAFHCHHNSLYEFVFDYDERVKFIKDVKPLSEQALRLKLFQLIPDDLLPGKNSPEWKAYEKTWEACKTAWEAYETTRDNGETHIKAEKTYEETWEDCDKAREAYDKMFSKEMGVLHRKLCPDCPWNGKTIFKGAK